MTTRPLGWHAPETRGRAPHTGARTAPFGILATLPVMVMLSALPPIYDQGAVGSCTAQALAGAVETIAPRAEYAPERPSRTALYWRERQMLGETGVDEGAIIADGVAVLRQGWEPERDYGLSWGPRWTAPPPALAEDAPRVVNSEALDIDVETIAYELACGTAVVVGLSVTADWDRLDGNTLPDPSGEVIGGHAVMLVGYRIDGDDVFFRVRNSWGESWGEGGYAWLPASWLRVPWCGEAHAIRAIRRAPERQHAHTPLDAFEARIMAAMPATATPAPAASRVLITGIVDIYDHDGVHDFATAKAGGMVAILRKATQGKDGKQARFASELAEAVRFGMLPGAYCFGSNSSPGEVQADFFLKTVDAAEKAAGMPARATLLALDWENNPNATNGTMTRENARRFVKRVHEKRGRWPMLYSGLSFLGSHVPDVDDVLKNCPLWLAKYGEPPTRVPPSWPSWFLWQYTNSAAGPADKATYPRLTPGFRRGQDRSAFRGTLDELRVAWSTVGLPTPSPNPCAT